MIADFAHIIPYLFLRLKDNNSHYLFSHKKYATNLMVAYMNLYPSHVTYEINKWYNLLYFGLQTINLNLEDYLIVELHHDVTRPPPKSYKVITIIQQV